MCNFISWYEKDNTAIFLTDDDLATKAGKKLKAISGMFPDDIKGHGAIRKFYELNEWIWPAGLTQKECTDFSSPNNFPPQIVETIKNCNLTQIGQQIGQMPESVLLKHGLDLIKNDAKWKEAEAKRDEAEAKRDEADAKWDEAYAKWDEAYAKRDEAEAKRKEAYAKWKEAYAKWKEAEAKRKEAEASVFWKVFANPKNRKKAWR